jgi:hypothetical protein
LVVGFVILAALFEWQDMINVLAWYGVFIPIVFAEWISARWMGREPVVSLLLPVVTVAAPGGVGTWIFARLGMLGAATRTIDQVGTIRATGMGRSIRHGKQAPAWMAAR